MILKVREAQNLLKDVMEILQDPEAK